MGTHIQTGVSCSCLGSFKPCLQLSKTLGTGPGARGRNPEGLDSGYGRHEACQVFIDWPESSSLHQISQCAYTPSRMMNLDWSGEI